LLKNYIRGLPAEEKKKALRNYRTVAPQNDDWLHDWVELYLGFDIPRKRVCEHHVAPFTAFANAYFARDPIAVWKASRGFGGKTVMLALLTLTEALTLGANVNILGGSGEQSQNVQAYISGTHSRTKGQFFDSPFAPRNMIMEAYKRELRLSNGALVRALMASATSVRGPHPQRLRLDEIDEMDVGIFDSALGQPMSAHGIKAHTVCSSTHQHVDGTMSDAMRRAKLNGWGMYEWCYRENLQSNGGWLDDDEVEEKKISIPTAMWFAEYEGQEPNPEGRIFSEDVLEMLFRPELGFYEGAEGQDIILSPALEGREYYTGTDWAKSHDWTVIHTMEKHRRGPDRLAAWIRMGRRKWPDMVGKHNERTEAYVGKNAHDITGVGSVPHDYMTVASRGVDFRNIKQRDRLLNRYVADCESGEFEYPMIKFMYEEHKYLTVDMLYGNEHTPDSIVAAALAGEARGSRSGKLLVARI
jgi:hypothetical protein